jgi:transcriptional regulator GlxA family with amidase domain
MPRSHTIRIAALIGLLLLPACGSQGASTPARANEGESLRDAAANRLLRAAFLIVDGVYNTELTAPYDILDHSIYHVPEGLGIEVITVSPSGGPVTTAEGLRILPDFGFDNAPQFDILVVPSAAGSRDSDLENRTLINWVRQRGKDAGAIMSLCWGAFVLAEADLLDARSATTFQSDYGSFARRFPKVELLVNLSFVHDGKVITSLGGARSFDAAMYLIDLLYGQEAARGVGGGLLISWPPTPDSGITYHAVR